MFDERWSDEVEEIGTALRRLLSSESTPARVRAAEATPDGRDRILESKLNEFGLDDVDGNPELCARLAYELGRSLATTPFVEALPVLAVLGQPGISFGFDGVPVPAALARVAVRLDDGVYVQSVNGEPLRSTAGDLLVQHVSAAAGERIADASAAARMARFADLANSARLVGAGQGLLHFGVAYARERFQFGKPIGGYQGVAHRLADAATLLDAADLLVRKAAFTSLPEAGGDGAPSSVFASMVRGKAVEAARFVATTVHQVFGGYGFAMEYDVQLYSRRLRSWAMRGRRVGADLAELGRALLDPRRRDEIRHLWHHEIGVPLPRWAHEAEVTSRLKK
jgi:hypothetical protein